MSFLTYGPFYQGPYWSSQTGTHTCNAAMPNWPCNCALTLKQGFIYVMKMYKLKKTSWLIAALLQRNTCFSKNQKYDFNQYEVGSF